MQEASKIQKTSSFNVLECGSSRKIFTPSMSLAFILPQYAEEYQHELEQQGEAIDAKYAKLLVQEQFWLRLYLDPNMGEYHDELLARLDSVQQRMTNLLLQLSDPNQLLG